MSECVYECATVVRTAMDSADILYKLSSAQTNSADIVYKLSSAQTNSAVSPRSACQGLRLGTTERTARLLTYPAVAA